jgi:KaiC/GvpD/RAD55 family RecA-like ATPase
MLSDDTETVTTSTNHIQAIELIPSGIKGLDQAIGGLPDKSVILLIGEPGCNNTTFVQHILWNYSTLGGKITYYLVGTTGTSVSQDMLSFGWKVDHHQKTSNWKFVNVFTPEISDLLINLAPSEQEQVNLTHNLNTLKRDFLLRAQHGHWTALDSITFLLLEYPPKEIYSLVRYCVVAAHLHGGIHFLIMYKGIHEEHILNTVQLLADGVIEFSLKETVRGLEGSLLIKKMRKNLKTRVIPFSVNESGFRVETAVRLA